MSDPIRFPPAATGGAWRGLEPGAANALGRVRDVQSEAGGSKYEGRLVALRQSEPAAERQRKRIRKVASHKGRKLEARSLKAEGFLYVFTDLPREVLPTAEALEMYRLRWQIELVLTCVNPRKNGRGLRDVLPPSSIRRARRLHCRPR